MDAQSVPVSFHRPGDTVAIRGNRRITREQFIAHVQHLADELPHGGFAVNLCQDRYLFLLALCATMIRGQTILLPYARLPKLIEEISAEYGGAYALCDRTPDGLSVEHHVVAPAENPSIAKNATVPRVRTDRLAVILFTSGSTGRPRPSPKRWGELVSGAKLVARRLGLGSSVGGTIVATVPPRHMYGLEVSISLPLVSGVGVHGATPLFPESIRRALASAPGPRWLFTTPTHLRACIELGFQWPSVDFVVSSSAPLNESLAARAEEIFEAPVFEIYGCTEAGAIATRRTVEGSRWRPCDGLQVSVKNDTAFVAGAHLIEPVPLSDSLEIHGDGGFELRGRNSDLVKVGGNRALLSDLNLKLNEIEGVEDGVFVMPETGDGEVNRRPIALVVAPNLEKKNIVAALADSVHSAFVPRPIYKVDRLPRDEVGKLRREDLLALIEVLARTD